MSPFNIPFDLVVTLYQEAYGLLTEGAHLLSTVPLSISHFLTTDVLANTPFEVYRKAVSPEGEVTLLPVLNSQDRVLNRAILSIIAYILDNIDDAINEGIDNSLGLNSWALGTLFTDINARIPFTIITTYSPHVNLLTGLLLSDTGTMLHTNMMLSTDPEEASAYLMSLNPFHNG